MHELWHFYASLLIRHGESVKAVQFLLGYATAAKTLDTYSHLWPNADDTTRRQPLIPSLVSRYAD